MKMFQYFLATLLLILFSHVAMATTENKTPAATQNEAEFIAWLIILNKNEISAAKTTLKKSKNIKVKDYASLMKKAHNKNLQDTINISRRIGIHAMSSKDAKVLQQEGREDAKNLAKLKNKNFDTAYIALMVKDHQHALQKIEGKFANKITNAQLEQHLETTKKHITEHLQKAQEIQTSLSYS